MEEIVLTLNNEASVGLGDNLCLLSALANIPPIVDLQVDDRHDTYNRLAQYKRIFRIPDSQLKVTRSKFVQGNLNNVGWTIKLFSEYYRPTYVNVNGQSLKVKDNNSQKKCIAIACSSDLSGPANEWPWCRSRPTEFWGRLMAWVKEMEYEVITVDHAYHNLENKIELMVKNCRAIISYEGGMAHLAHMLDMPCFILDWNLPSPSTTLDRFHCEFVHMTNSVYIVRNDEELFKWNKNDFDTKIFALENGNGNNRLVNGTAKYSFAGPGVSGNVRVVSQGGVELLNAPPMFGPTKQLTQLLNDYYSK
jgi:hypothetical protein